MADADCEMCEMMGYRSCDICTGPVFHPIPGAARDFCGYHLGTGEMTDEEEIIWSANEEVIEAQQRKKYGR